MSVKISEFVKEALLEITKGVREAYLEADVTIAAGHIDGKPILTPSEVSFEIFVEVSEQSSTSGKLEGGGSFLSVVKASTSFDGQKTFNSANSQRITFSVPVHFNSHNVRKNK
jgi:hypothetical protein